jgi:hypothetical protein
MNRRYAVFAVVLMTLPLFEMQYVEMAKSNPIPKFPALDILSPVPYTYTSYQNTSVQLTLQLRLPEANNSRGYSPEVSHVCYSLDSRDNITLQNIPKSGTEYSLFGEFHFVCILVNSTLHNLAEGPHTLEAYSFDTKGEVMSNSVEFEVDTRRIPNISIISPLNIIYLQREIPLIFFTDEACQNLSYRIDNHNPVHINGNTTLTGLTNGSHKIVIRGNNTVGRFGHSNDTYFIVRLQGRDLLANELSNTSLGLSIVMVILMVAVASALLVYFRRRKGKQ